MSYDADITAISSWTRHDQGDDPNEGGYGVSYACTACAWAGRGMKAYEHHKQTGHTVRGRNWPSAWGVAVFSDGGTR